MTDESDVGAVRRAVYALADRMGANGPFAAVASETATELATNLVRHARPTGWMLIRPLRPAGVELLAVDHGPGIRDVAAALAGRTAGRAGLGRGLASARAASTCFDVHSDPDRGTVVLAVVEARHGRRSAAVEPPRSWAGISVGIDEACGDGWAVVPDDGGLSVAVIDGLGHGIHASMATDAAIGALATDPADLDGYLARANTALRHTRGAALALCHLDAGRGELRCLSVGNINAVLLRGGGPVRIEAVNGTVGLRDAPPAAKVVPYPWSADASLVLWSDGLPSRLDLAAERDLLRHDPAVAAAVLHRDHTRDRDDATVVVVRQVAP